MLELNSDSWIYYECPPQGLIQFLGSTTTFTTSIESKQDKMKVVFVRDMRKKRDKVSW